MAVEINWEWCGSTQPRDWLTYFYIFPSLTMQILGNTLKHTITTSFYSYSIHHSQAPQHRTLYNLSSWKVQLSEPRIDQIYDLF